MGFFDRRREAKAAQVAEQAREQAGESLSEWEAVEERLLEFLEEARTFSGQRSDAPLNLKKDEVAFLVLNGACLIEPRRLPGQWQGRSSGFSFRVMKGVSYRVGGSRGTFVQGDEQPQPVDDGVVTVTNRRVVFQGTKASREWAFSKMLGTQHVDIPGETCWTAVQVSNRQKVSGFLYTDEVAPLVQFRLALAMAHCDGEVDDLIKVVEEQLGTHRQARPAFPPTTPATTG